MNNFTDETSVWYKEFWVWFIILLIGSAIAACLWTIVIAVGGADQVVSDSYYKDGLTINKNIALDQKARALNLSATLNINQHDVTVTLSEPMQDNLSLTFSHPIEKAKDFTIKLQHQGNKKFTGTLPKKISYRWYITLKDAKNQWQLKSTLNIEPNKKTIESQLSSTQ